MAKMKHIAKLYTILTLLVDLTKKWEGGMNLDLYMGDSDLTQLYNDCVNEVIPLPSSNFWRYILNK